ncbi:GNAT family N-acetyltransferase [Chitinimonas lacunae]|uniref:GNAT family N-acetyltransferase n=1 Tax=Chitinimonas lacunae TaxID=1963018 RepID=A0ABV8MPW1_9NEIS
MPTPLVPSQHAAVLALIAQANSDPTQHCLHIARDPAGIAADLASEGIDLGRGWLALWQDGVPQALCGIHVCDGHGWLYGPWSRDPADSAARRTVLAATLALPENQASRLYAYIDAPATPLIADVEAAGFSRYVCAQVMRSERPAPAPVPSRFQVTPFAPGQLPAVTAIHREAFPDTYLDATAMAARNGPGEHLLTVEADGELLGYLAMLPELDGREAYIEYVAVRPDRRGQGVGRALLDAALTLAYADPDLSAVNLTVRNDKPEALKLYQRAGFALVYRGIGLRREAQCPAV